MRTLVIRAMAAAVGAVVVLCVPVVAAAQERRPLPRVAIEDTSARNADTVIGQPGTLPFPVAVRLQSPTASLDAAMTARLADLAKRSVPVWLTLPAPETPEAIEDWRTTLRALLSRSAPALTVLEIAIDDQPERVASFAIQTAATEVGEERLTVRLALGGRVMADAGRRAALFNPELAPYVDLLAVPAGAEPEVRRWLEERQIAINLAVTPLSSAGGNLVDAVLEDLGTSVHIRGIEPNRVTAADLRALVPLAALLTHEVTPLDDDGVELRLAVEDTSVTAATRKRLLFDTDTFSTFLVYWRDAAAPSLQVALLSPMDGTPAVVDLQTGARVPARGYTRDAATGRVSLTAPQTGHPMLVDFNEGAVPIAERSGVTVARVLSVSEVIARHQQQQRAQDALVDDYMATVRMEQHFRPSIADPGYDVVTENRFFSAQDGVEWQELSFAVNNSKWGEDRPPFPLLQPEKVLALPLAAAIR